MQKIRLSVVMPSFNEEEAIGPMIEEIRRYTSEYDTEILLVDSSRDATPAIAESLGARVITQPPRGHGIALRTAILNASGDYVITSDCDNTYPMARVPEFVQLLHEQGYDLVSGNRLTPALKKEMPFSNLLANRSFAFIVRLLYGIPTHDVTTGMFGFRREVIHAIDWETNYSFPSEIIIRSNLNKFKYIEVPIQYRIRVGEVTLNKWKSGKAYIRCFMKYKWFKNISVDKL